MQYSLVESVLQFSKANGAKLGNSFPYNVIPREGVIKTQPVVNLISFSRSKRVGNIAFSIPYNAKSRYE